MNFIMIKRKNNKIVNLQQIQSIIRNKYSMFLIKNWKIKNLFPKINNIKIDYDQTLKIINLLISTFHL